MSKVAVIGYASIDFPAVLDGFFAGDRTVMIRQCPADAFPRPGGCPLYVARPIAGQGIGVSIVTWVGADQHGELFVSWTEKDGVGVDGIATIEPGNTPVCFMIYQQDGSCGCLFDPGMLGREKLTQQQKELIAAAEMLCVTVGPPGIAREALGLIAEDCRIASDRNRRFARNRPQPITLPRWLFCASPFILRAITSPGGGKALHAESGVLPIAAFQRKITHERENTPDRHGVAGRNEPDTG